MISGAWWPGLPNPCACPHLHPLGIRSAPDWPEDLPLPYVCPLTAHHRLEEGHAAGLSPPALSVSSAAANSSQLATCIWPIPTSIFWKRAFKFSVPQHFITFIALQKMIFSAENGNCYIKAVILIFSFLTLSTALPVSNLVLSSSLLLLL